MSLGLETRARLEEHLGCHVKPRTPPRGTNTRSTPVFYAALHVGVLEDQETTRWARLAGFEHAGQISPKLHSDVGTDALFFRDIPRGNGHGPHTHMIKVKDTLRSMVQLTFDGRVIKVYHGPDAKSRFTNEVRVLRHLEERGCPFVPRLLEADEGQLRIVTTNCGGRVEHLDPERELELFAELKAFGVRHEDPDKRNITYRRSDGRFCIIDFEFAALLTDPPETHGNDH